MLGVGHTRVPEAKVSEPLAPRPGVLCRMSWLENVLCRVHFAVEVILEPAAAGPGAVREPALTVSLEIVTCVCGRCCELS